MSTIETILYDVALKVLRGDGFIVLRYDDSSSNSRKFYGLRSCMNWQVNWGRLESSLPCWNSGRLQSSTRTKVVEAFHKKLKKGYRVAGVQIRNQNGSLLAGHSPMGASHISYKDGKWGIYTAYGSLIALVPTSSVYDLINQGMRLVEARSLGNSCY